MKAAVVLGDVFEDPVKRKSSRLEDSAFQRAHAVSAFNYYGEIVSRFLVQEYLPASTDASTKQPERARLFEVGSGNFYDFVTRYS